MNFEALYDYISDVAQAINGTDGVQFYMARKTKITSIPIPTDGIPVFWCLLPNSTGDINFDSQQVEETWNVSVLIYNTDDLDNEVNANAMNVSSQSVNTLKTTNDLADKFIRLFNQNELSDSLQASSELLDITSVNKEPFVNDTAHCLTGWGINMSVKVPDEFDYCKINE